VCGFKEFLKKYLKFTVLKLNHRHSRLEEVRVPPVVLVEKIEVLLYLKVLNAVKFWANLTKGHWYKSAHNWGKNPKIIHGNFWITLYSSIDSPSKQHRLD